MNVTKVATSVASCCLVLLLFIVVIVKPPQQSLYEKAINSVMVYEGLSSEQQAISHCPQLRKASKNMDRIAQLNGMIHGMTAGPAPDLSGTEIGVLENYRLEVEMLRKAVESQLIEVVAAYTKGLAIRTDY